MGCSNSAAGQGATANKEGNTANGAPASATRRPKRELIVLDGDVPRFNPEMARKAGPTNNTHQLSGASVINDPTSAATGGDSLPPVDPRSPGRTMTTLGSQQPASGTTMSTMGGVSSTTTTINTEGGTSALMAEHAAIKQLGRQLQTERALSLMRRKREGGDDSGTADIATFPPPRELVAASSRQAQSLGSHPSQSTTTSSEQRRQARSMPVIGTGALGRSPAPAAGGAAPAGTHVVSSLAAAAAAQAVQDARGDKSAQAGGGQAANNAGSRSTIIVSALCPSMGQKTDEDSSIVSTTRNKPGDLTESAFANPPSSAIGSQSTKRTSDTKQQQQPSTSEKKGGRRGSGVLAKEREDPLWWKNYIAEEKDDDGEKEKGIKQRTSNPDSPAAMEDVELDLQDDEQGGERSTAATNQRASQQHQQEPNVDASLTEDEQRRASKQIEKVNRRISEWTVETSIAPDCDENLMDTHSERSK